MKVLDSLILGGGEEAFARSLPPLRDIDRPELLDRLHDMQLRLIYTGTPAQLIASLSTIALICVVAWPSTPPATVLLWAVAIIAGMGYGIILTQAFARAPYDSKDRRTWVVRYLCGLNYCAVVWGCAVWFLVPGSPALQAVLLILLAITMAGGASQQYAYMPAAVSFQSTIAVVIAAGLVARAEQNYALLSLSFLVLGAVCAIVNIGVNRAVTRSAFLSWALERQLARSEQDRMALESAKEDLERANGAKSRFLAAASHDLRQPMHAIGLLVAALRRQPDEHVRDRQLALVERSVDALEGLCAGILDVSTLDAGEVTLKPGPVFLDSVLDHLELQFGPIARERGLTFEWRRCGYVVHVDPFVLDRILRNLIANAIRYTQSGGILVRCRRRADRCVVQVWDSGIGISLEHRALIFEEFFQVGNPQRDRSKGVGLGLSIARRSANLLGSDIEVRSRPGRGSLFSVALSLSSDTGAALSAGQVDPDGIAAGIFVLLVDDEELIRFAAKALLESMGAACLACASADEALERLAGDMRIPDLLICDYRLGAQTDGLRTIGAIREQLQEHIPSVLVTGDMRSGLEEECRRAGVMLARKPLSAGRLAKIIVDAQAGEAPVVTRSQATT